MEVIGLSRTAIKATALQIVDAVELAPAGVMEDRRFFLIDERNRLVNGKTFGWLQTVVADYSHPSRRLSVRFPDGRVASEDVRIGESVTAKFTGREVVGSLVEGPFSEIFSDLAGKPLRLVEAPSDGSAVDRGMKAGVSLVSRASVERVGEQGDGSPVDWRRFRMLIEIDGVEAHEEDGWVGHSVAIGDAVVQFEGHVGRCLVTTRDPDSGEIDVPMLEMLRSYRSELPSTEPLPFGVYGRVMRNGRVRLGDPVVLQD